MSRDLEAAAKVQQSLLPSSDVENLGFIWHGSIFPAMNSPETFSIFFSSTTSILRPLWLTSVATVSLLHCSRSPLGDSLTRNVSATSLLMQPGDNGNCVVPPAEVARELNRRFPMEEQNGLYFTMLYGVLNLESLEFKFVSAGHDPVVHLRETGKPNIVEGEGMSIGWMDDVEYDDQVIQLQPGDRLFLYSDGVPEAMDPDMNQFGMQQMHDILELGQSQSLDDCVSLLLNSVKRWCADKGPLDDVSILGLQISES